MNSNDVDPPVADDDFPEFNEPPRHKPGPSHGSMAKKDPEPAASDAQAKADEIRERLRQKRAEGTD
jgi:hypothetical protein